jgi:RNA polymerase sigma factor (TIGR02999 family)
MSDTIVVLLSRLNGGDRTAFNQLFALVYDDLHRIAEGYMRRESQSHTLQAGALLHEAYLRLVDHGSPEYKNTAHFFGVAARVMRQILVDHARAAMRQSGYPDVSLKATAAPERSRVLNDLDDALALLALVDPFRALLVEMRFFCGLTAEEIAASLETPVHSVRRDLRAARGWLRRYMNSGEPNA